MRMTDVLDYCGAKPGAVEDFPFGEGVAVFKVMGKMFALCSLAEPGTVSLKCDPDFALELRAVHTAVQPGYHLNKRHWNTVTLEGSIEDEEVAELIDHSYDLVVAGLPKRQRQQLAQVSPREGPPSR